MIELVKDYWYFPLIVFVFGVLVGNYVIAFFRQPTEQQTSKLVEWLKYAVAFAEKDLGSGTGQLKLRYVYNMFLEKFPRLATLITLDEFDGYVNEALVWMRSQVEQNKNIQTFING